MRPSWLVAGALAVQAAGCTTAPTGGVVCTDQFVPGISVAAVDSVSGVPVLGASAIGREGAFVDSTTTPGMLAGERAGTYTVTVRKSGYATWLKSGVVVTRDQCHVKTVSLTAKLQPSP